MSMTIKNYYKIEVIRSRGTWYWRLKSFNGNILAHSEKYSGRVAAMSTAKKLAQKLRCKLEVIS